MKLRPQTRLVRQHGMNCGDGTRGIALLETLIYVALFFLVVGLAFMAFYRTDEQSRALRRSADDITASMTAGERWRADVRKASQAPIVSDSAFKIPQGAADVTYFIRSNAVWRQAGTASPELLINRVLVSEFRRDERQFVTAWHWNVELKKHRHNSSMRPLFTFTAVPPRRNQQ